MHINPWLLPSAAGLLMALPFTETLIPNGWLYVIAVTSIALGSWHSTKSFQNVSPVFYWIVLLTTWQLIIIIISESAYKSALINEVIIALMLIFGALLASASGVSEKALKVFIRAISIIGVSSAVLGLVKQALLDRGILITILVGNNTLNSYPQGTSLSLDYNDAALLWLVALTCIFPLYTRKMPGWTLVASAILVAAIIGVGSRRGLMALMLLPLATCGLYLLKGLLRDCLQFIGRATASIGLSAVLLLTITNPAEFEKLKMRTTVNLSGVTLPPRAYPSVIASTMNYNMADSRLERIHRALPLQRKYPLLGSGFRYHAIYTSGYRDYPHLRFFTEVLIGGAAYGLSILCLFGYTLVQVLKNLLHASNLGHLKLSAVFIVVSVFWISSGDTWLSMAQWLSVALLINTGASNPRLRSMKQRCEDIKALKTSPNCSVPGKLDAY